jgi:4-amino-4-deoxy-L-arabinose transferase-like glycosyltransferase
MTHPTSRWSKKKILALAGVTLLVHAILLFFVFPALSARLSVSYNQDVFADGYDSLAANLAAGNGYRFYPDTAPTLMREPGYPLLLAGVRLVFGDSLTAVKIVNLLLALATALLVLKLAARFTSRQWAMMAAALLFLFHPAPSWPRAAAA